MQVFVLGASNLPWDLDHAVLQLVLMTCCMQVLRRFEKRITDPRRQWKLSPTDLESRRKWYSYSKARDQMLEATDTEESPWNLIRSDDKKRARLNCISHLLSQIPYSPAIHPEVKMPDRLDHQAYDDVASIAGRNWVPEKF